MIAEFIGLNLQGSIDRKLDSIDRTTCRFIFLQSSSSAQTLLKRIRVQVKLSYIRETLERFLKLFLERLECLLCLFLFVGFCTQRLSKGCSYCGLCKSPVRSRGAFLYTNLGFSRRRYFLHLDDQFSCCH